jgi:hypothetical protein
VEINKEIKENSFKKMDCNNQSAINSSVWGNTSSGLSFLSKKKTNFISSPPNELLPKNEENILVREECLFLI